MFAQFDPEQTLDQVILSCLTDPREPPPMTGEAFSQLEPDKYIHILDVPLAAQHLYLAEIQFYANQDAAEDSAERYEKDSVEYMINRFMADLWWARYAGVMSLRQEMLAEILITKNIRFPLDVTPQIEMLESWQFAILAASLPEEYQSEDAIIQTNAEIMKVINDSGKKKVH